jgi:small multidrug resistance pump
VRPERWKGALLLGAAIGCEVGGTLLLRASAGFTRPWAGAGVLAGYVVSVLLFSRALRHGLTLGVAYGTLTGCGLGAATLASLVVFGEPVSLAQGGGLALVLAGALLLQWTPGPVHP